MDDFQVIGLAREKFNDLLSLNDQELRRYHAEWRHVDEYPGYPCRVSLEEARVGERVLVLPYEHLGAASPYRASGPIFVREKAITRHIGINELPNMVMRRPQSVRAYDKNSIMIAAEVVEGEAVSDSIAGLMQRTEVEYVHLHNARPGCFNCAVHRVGA